MSQLLSHYEIMKALAILGKNIVGMPKNFLQTVSKLILRTVSEEVIRTVDEITIRVKES